VYVVDTNVLIYAANSSAAEHAKCRHVLDTLRAGPNAWYLTWGICFEFLRVVTHPRVFAAPWTSNDAWGFIEVLLSSPGCRMLSPEPSHSAVVRALVADSSDLRGNIWHDAETVALMKASGIRRVISRDSDFHRFTGIEVLDPLRTEFT